MHPVLPQTFMIVVERDAAGKGRIVDVLDLSWKVRDVFERSLVKGELLRLTGKEMPATVEGWEHLIRGVAQEASGGGVIEGQ